jgi:hypothetical protein
MEEREARKVIARHAERLATIVDQNPVDADADVNVLTLAAIAQCMQAICLLNEDGRVSALDAIDLRQQLEGQN